MEEKIQLEIAKAEDILWVKYTYLQISWHSQKGNIPINILYE